MTRCVLLHKSSFVSSCLIKTTFLRNKSETNFLNFFSFSHCRQTKGVSIELINWLRNRFTKIFQDQENDPHLHYENTEPIKRQTNSTHFLIPFWFQTLKSWNAINHFIILHRNIFIKYFWCQMNRFDGNDEKKFQLNDVRSFYLLWFWEGSQLIVRLDDF